MASRIPAISAIAALLACGHAALAADLTPTEQRWLDGATPPLSWALKQGLPIDIVVLPQAQPGAAPIAMGYEDGRCKLVFAMRGNPAAQATLEAIPAPLLQATIEAMTAHEIGHCQRHRSGTFDRLPAGLADEPDAIESRQPTAELQAMAREMRVTRREEAYADLVGLAWTHAHHADQFAPVLAWSNGFAPPSKAAGRCASASQWRVSWKPRGVSSERAASNQASTGANWSAWWACVQARPTRSA